MQNGKPRTYPKRKADYQADVYTDIATSVIRAHARSKKPYFLNVAYLAPHAQAASSTAAGADGDELHAAVPAPRDAHRFDHTPLPRSAAYDEADVSDKPAGIQRAAAHHPQGPPHHHDELRPVPGARCSRSTTASRGS